MEKSVSAGIERSDQWVASAGVVRKVCSITAAILIVIDGSRPARSSVIEQVIITILQEPASPPANRVFMDAKLGSNRVAGQPVGTAQNDAAHRSDSDRATG